MLFNGGFLKKNITRPETVYYQSRKRKPLLHDFVTNLIASFGEITSLKKYAMSMFAFLLLLLMSGSYSLSAKETLSDGQNASIMRIDSLNELSVHQQQDVLNAIDQASILNVLNISDNSETQSDPYPSAQRNVYLMNNAAQAFPYTIYLGGANSYSVEEIALKHYGTDKAIDTIISANPNLNFNSLKTGDRVYLPLVNTEVLYGYVDATTPDSVTNTTETEVASAIITTEASVAPTEPEVIHVVETAPVEIAPIETAAPIETVVETAAPSTEATTVSQTMPPVSSYVVSASPETVDMYVRIVAAESSPSWDYEGQLMIAQTIINRALSGKWGDLYSVLTAPNQYDVYSNGRYRSIHVTDDQRRAAMDALNGVTALDRDVIYFCTTYAYSPHSWWGTLDHRATFDNTMFFAP